MMKGIFETYKEYKRRALEEGERVLMVLEGLEGDAKRSLLEEGATVVSQRWETWCHSDTCQHVSHDAGVSYTELSTPQEWIIPDEFLREAEEIWELGEDETALLILPYLSVLVFRKDGHWAGRTFLKRFPACIGLDVEEAARNLVAKRIGFAEFKRIVRENS